MSNSVREFGKRFVSMRTRRRIALARVAIRRPTAKWRPLPNLLIIGSQRAGTSSLFKYLSGHPQCKASVRKEIRFFTEYYHEGPEWYRAHFSLRRGGGAESPIVAFDATPDYLLDPRVPQRAHEMIANARIVILLRDPAERALSHYQHNRRLGLEHLTFEEALRLESKRIAPDLCKLDLQPSMPIGKNLLKYSYVERGRYAQQIERWMSIFDRSQFLILRSEDFFCETDAVFQRILAFLGLKEWHPAKYENHSYFSDQRPPNEEVPSRSKEMIEHKLREDRGRLRELIGFDL